MGVYGDLKRRLVLLRGQRSLRRAIKNDGYFFSPQGHIFLLSIRREPMPFEASCRMHF